MARPVAKVLVVVSQILKIFELTTPRVVLARPRVGCQFCPLLLSFLLHSIHLQTRPVSAGHDPVSSFMFLLFCGLDVNQGLASCINSFFFVFMLVFALFLLLLHI
ncbi:hypothetical protein HanRHA438_Chr04g0177801 [Helianthus annuus]|nr:hypothetical protein HanRHA438_Chr04g0177801 [Helianthus annuus]